MQQIVCHKCRCPNKFGTVFCRNCGTKLKVQDSQHPDRAGVLKIKKAIARLFKLAVILTVVTFLAGLFLPFGMTKYPAVAEDGETARVRKICEDIDKSIARDGRGMIVAFSLAELTYAVNHLLDPERPPVKVDAEPVRPVGLSGGAALTSGRDLGRAGDLSRSADGAAQTTCPPPPQDQKRKPSSRERKKVDQLTVNFAFDVTSDLDLRIVMSGVMLEVFPYRFEIVGSPQTTRNEDDPASRTELTFDLKSARYGYVPLPMMIKERVIALFRTIAFSRDKVENYLKNVRVVDIKAQDHIEIALGK